MPAPRTKARQKKDSDKLRNSVPDDLFEPVSDEEVASQPKPKTGDADRLAAMAKVGSAFKDNKPAREVLRVVRAIPTIFPWFDWTTRVGGMPIERIALVHGPSNHGKTIFAHGIGKSFLQRGQFYRLCDVERTTPITWIDKLWGKDYANHPGFSAVRPPTYEDAVDDVRRWASTIAEARAKGTLPDDTTGLYVVDSIRKLVPANFFEKVNALVKKGKDVAEEIGIDGFSGRGAQIKALYNSTWMDELVVLMEQTRCAIMFIARESETPGQTPKHAPIIKIGGGGALYYDSSLVLRVKRANWMVEGKSDVDSGTVVGERHEVAIHKTKVAGKDDRVVRSFFHTSNGNIPELGEGFSRPWDLLGLGERLGVVEKAGGWLRWPGVRVQGEPAAIRKLAKNPTMMDELETMIRARFKMEAEEEVDQETGVVTNPHTA